MVDAVIEYTCWKKAVEQSPAGVITITRGITMTDGSITDKDREMAKRCMECPVCSRGRANQRGLAYLFVKFVEGGMCPQCKAYEKVYGRKAHEPVPTE